MSRSLLLKFITALVLVTIALFAALPFALPRLVKSVAERELQRLGWPCLVELQLHYGWNDGPEIAGKLRLQLQDTPWRITADFDAGICRWSLRLAMPKTAFSEADPTIARLLNDHPLPAISNLVCSGSVSFDASAERTWSMPVPVWSVRLPIRDVAVSLTNQGRPISVSGLSVTPSVSGINRHVDCPPVRLFVRSATASGFSLTNLTVRAQLTENKLRIDEANAGFCGGRISLYSAFLDPASLNAGLTLFLDDIEAGEVMRHFHGFRGTASGRLHGRMKLFARKGGESLRFSNGYLYSVPGETGKLQLADSDGLTGNLALTGLDDATCRNVANALTDLDYNVLRLDLRRRNSDDESTLCIRIRGSATRKALTVPVDLNINIKGKIEQIVNTGLGYAQALKGRKP